MFTDLALPATVTVMYESALRDVLKAYGIECREIYEYQKGYRNEIWPVKTADGQMINVTFYKREAGITDRIKRADTVSEYLRACGMPTRRRIDPRMLQLKRSGIITCVGVYDYLPGGTIPWEAYTMTHLKLLGKTMSDMHAYLAEMRTEGFPTVYDEYDEIIKRMRQYFSEATVQRAVKKKLQLDLDETALDRSINTLRQCRELSGQQVLHMDFVRGNVLFDDSAPQYSQQLDSIALSGILDFEKTAIGHPIVDAMRTLAFLLVDCKHKSAIKVEKYFLYSGYQKRGNSKNIGSAILRHDLVKLFLLYDFYKFLRHNPYEFLHSNAHYLRTRDILLEQNMIRYI